VKRSKWLKLDPEGVSALVEAALDTSPVVGLTHNHYKYPARFSPKFAEAAIRVFTKPGDLVFDPFMGGGTSIVEALANGRNAAGVDISSLAAFVAETKTLHLKDHELDSVKRWTLRLGTVIDIHQPSASFPEWEEAGYYRNLNLSSNWRLTKAIEQALGAAERLRARKAQQLARCIVLRTAQWALDGRKTLPSVEEFRNMMAIYAEKMIAGALAFRIRKSKFKLRKPRYSNRSVVGLQKKEAFGNRKSPKLVVTSPPYPGIHVLYHRWQVDGRKETPAPFWIANKLDGAGLSHYTMGDRKYPGLKTYFDNMQAAFASISECVTQRTIIVQMIAFSDPSWQLDRYLEMMENAGFAELFIKGHDSRDGRLWRSVPGRKWYSDQRGETPGSQEVVLFHRKAAKTSVVRQPSGVFAARSSTAER
jgi:hypothetical protein